MFEGVKPLGKTDRSIPLATRDGDTIKNSVAPEILAPDLVRKVELFVQKYGQGWIERKPTTGIYNCAGMVWACRRTAIYEPEVFQSIIEKDQYRVVDDLTDLQPGDLVIYRDAENMEILHVGRVYNIINEPQMLQPMPWVISKWDDMTGEYLHRANDIFYGQYGYKVNIEYYTDRP